MQEERCRGIWQGPSGHTSQRCVAIAEWDEGCGDGLRSKTRRNGLRFCETTNQLNGLLRRPEVSYPLM